jgi:hypothetical protein
VFRKVFEIGLRRNEAVRLVMEPSDSDACHIEPLKNQRGDRRKRVRLNANVFEMNPNLYT